MVSESSKLLNKRLIHFLANRLKWKDFNPIQNEAIPVILEGNDSLIIAPTASGKTESVLLPIFSEILDNYHEPLSVLYVSPLKSLINDMDDRINLWANHFNLNVTKWHGDVSKSIKDKFFKKPSDFLLITPESLEVIFMNKKESEKRKVFKNLKYVIIDEIHYFAEYDRGIQLNSLLNRIDQYCEEKPVRLGLSATVGNPTAISKWLNYNEPAKIVKSSDSRKLQYKVWSVEDSLEILKRLKKYVGKKVIIFVPKREAAENYYYAMKKLRYPNIFIHHSSIDKQTREESERNFKNYDYGFMVSTSTLELGIDIGDIDVVVHIKPPYSVNAFLQRIGRGGRKSGLQRTIVVGKNMGIVMTLAELILVKDGVIEDINIPTNSKDVFFHQILSSIFEEGKVDYKELYYRLTSSYVFSDISKKEYQKILDYMEEQEFIYKNQGFLTLGYNFEKKFGKSNFMNFYSVFCPSFEYDVKEGNVVVGSLDVSFVPFLRRNSTFVLSGKPWKVLSVDHKHSLIKVIYDINNTENMPMWTTDGPTLNYLISRTIYDVLLGHFDKKLIKTFDKKAIEDLNLAQSKALECGFSEGIIPVELNSLERKVYIYTFAGDKANSLLSVLFSFYDDIFDISITPFYAAFKLRHNFSFDFIQEVIYGAEKVLNSSDIYTLIHQFTDKFYKNKFINFLPEEDQSEIKMRILYDKDNLIKVINENTLVQVSDVNFEKWFPEEDEEDNENKGSGEK